MMNKLIDLLTVITIVSAFIGCIMAALLLGILEIHDHGSYGYISAFPAFLLAMWFIAWGLWIVKTAME